VGGGVRTAGAAKGDACGRTFMSCDGSSKLLEKISRFAEEENASSNAAAADPSASKDCVPGTGDQATVALRWIDLTRILVSSDTKGRVNVVFVLDACKCWRIAL
jgi:hypothetical protein